MRHSLLATLVTVGGLSLIGGCGVTDLPNSPSATLLQITDIVSDTGLTASEKRTQLSEFGLSAAAINGLLSSERTGNQFGGDLRTAYTKVAGGTFTTLTPDEVQLFTDGVSAVDTEDTLDVTLTDDEAQAIVQLFKDFGLRNAEALTAFLDDENATVPSDIPDGVLREFFVDFDLALLLPDLP